MPLTLDLPAPVNEELAAESRREGVSDADHAALLLCLASALAQDEAQTPFQKAVKAFLSARSVDAQRVVSVLEDLVRICLDVHGAGESAPESQEKAVRTSASPDYALLRQWRDSTVHRPSFDAGESAHGERLRALLAEWQAEDRTPLRPMLPSLRDETPTLALFRKWREEDAGMTEEEHEAEDRLWEEIEQGLAANGRSLLMRKIG